MKKFLEWLKKLWDSPLKNMSDEKLNEYLRYDEADGRFNTIYWNEYKRRNHGRQTEGRNSASV